MEKSEHAAEALDERDIEDAMEADPAMAAQAAAEGTDGAEGRKKPIRLTHHTERPVFPADGKKEKAYFKDLDDNYSRCWCVNRVRDSFRSEIAFYQERYGAALKARNQTHIKNRHPGRTITIKDMHGKKRTCPEELTIQAGGKGGDGIPGLDAFKCCVMRYLSWMRDWGLEHGDCLHVLGVYISKEIPYKAVIRRVWDCPGKSGFTEVNMVGALKMAGIPCPNQRDEEDSRFNNRKMTFDRMSREVLYKCFEDAGVVANREPRIYTLRRALEVKKITDMEEQYAKDVLREIMEIETQAPPMTEDTDIPGLVVEPDGSVLVSEDAYRIFKIRECMAGAFAAKRQAAGQRLMDALDMEREAQKAYAVQDSLQKTTELEYAALRIGLLKCGYYARDGDIDENGENVYESVTQQFEDSGFGEP